MDAEYKSISARDESDTTTLDRQQDSSIYSYAHQVFTIGSKFSKVSLWKRSKPKMKKRTFKDIIIENEQELQSNSVMDEEEPPEWSSREGPDWNTWRTSTPVIPSDEEEEVLPEENRRWASLPAMSCRNIHYWWHNFDNCEACEGFVSGEYGRSWPDVSSDISDYLDLDRLLITDKEEEEEEDNKEDKNRDKMDDDDVENEK